MPHCRRGRHWTDPAPEQFEIVLDYSIAILSSDFFIFLFEMFFGVTGFLLIQSIYKSIN